jgi:hypothetical protein
LDDLVHTDQAVFLLLRATALLGEDATGVGGLLFEAVL